MYPPETWYASSLAPPGVTQKNFTVLGLTVLEKMWPKHTTSVNCGTIPAAAAAAAAAKGDGKGDGKMSKNMKNKEKIAAT